MLKKIAPYTYHIGLVQATVATLGSLYLSDIAGYPPCTLCWYQRIAMYPLIIIFAVAIIRNNEKASWYYALPLALIGWGIALYHNLLYYGIIKDSIIPCQAGISCTSEYLEWFGFVTIPFLSFMAFSIILVALAIQWKYGRDLR